MTHDYHDDHEHFDNYDHCEKLTDNMVLILVSPSPQRVLCTSLSSLETTLKERNFKRKIPKQNNPNFGRAVKREPSELRNASPKEQKSQA